MSTPPNWDRVQGDEEDTLTAGLDGVLDLTGVAAVVGLVRLHEDDDPVELEAEVLDPAARSVTVKLGTWLPTAEPGVWEFSVKATWSGSPARSVTWSPRKAATITVSANRST